MIWVIDASALIRLFIPDGPVLAVAETALNSASRGGGLVLAPQLLLAEAANVLLRKERRGELTPMEVDAILTDVKELPIRLSDHETLVSPACELARTYGLTVYDALYLALAEHSGARLLTCDDKLDKVAGTIGLK